MYQSINKHNHYPNCNTSQDSIPCRRILTILFQHLIVPNHTLCQLLQRFRVLTKSNIIIRHIILQHLLLRFQTNNTAFHRTRLTWFQSHRYLPHTHHSKLHQSQTLHSSILHCTPYHYSRMQKC